MILREEMIPMSDEEMAALKTIRDVVSVSRMEPNEQGPLQVEGETGAVWVITGKKVERVK